MKVSFVFKTPRPLQYDYIEILHDLLASKGEKKETVHVIPN